MFGELHAKKWGLLVAVFLPIGLLAMFFLQQPYRTWIVPVVLVLFWGTYYTWVGMEKRKKKLAKSL